MRVRFEELGTPQRAGGVEAATSELCRKLKSCGLEVSRSGEEPITSRASVDLAQFHGIWSPRLAIRLLKYQRRGVPCLVTPHGMLSPWAMRHKRAKKAVAWRLYQRRLLNRAQGLHATSWQEKEHFRNLQLTPPIFAVPWGIEIPGNSSDPDYGSKTALFVGRIYPVKGLPMLVKAWAAIRPAGWKMRIVGPDEAGHREELVAHVRSQGLEDSFVFSGPLSGTAKFFAYQQASLFILPSYTENFGMAVGEALASGLPVITTTGTPWEELHSNDCGWWVPPDVEAIAGALRKATSLSPTALAEKGRRGRQMVASRYSWDRVAAQMVEVYRSITQNKSLSTPSNSFSPAARLV